jgi:hypothetical protein
MVATERPPRNETSMAKTSASDLFFKNSVKRNLVLGGKTYALPNGIKFFVTSERVGQAVQSGASFHVRHYSINRICPEGTVSYCPGTTRGQFTSSANAHKFIKSLGI